MPLGRGRALALAAATALVVLGLGAVSPFQAVEAWLTGGGETVTMQPVHRDAATSDVLGGEDLLKSLSAVKPPPDGARRILFLGNSQQYTSSLPRGKKPDLGREVSMASDLFAASLEARAPGRFVVYNGAAPNQHVAEAFWQANYWFRVMPSPPGVLVLQSSFDTWRKSGVRAGFQTLLDDPRFLAAEEALRADRAYAAEFLAARREHDERKKVPAETRAADEKWTVEGAIRTHMELVPLYRDRESSRAAFLGVLYLGRVQLLGISPTTRRHILGQPYHENLDALVDLLDLARERGARVLVYNAPVNPAVEMFYEDEYRDYVAALRALTGERGCLFLDLATTVPAEDWGYWIDGPDPIHFNEQGHRLVAGALERALGAELTGR